MNRRLKLKFAHLMGLFLSVAPWLPASAVTVEQAMAYSPMQKDVDYERPTAKEMAECTIANEKVEEASALVVRGPAGQALRAFLDLNGDNRVDQWRYFQNGAECYRDIDSDFNGKADQYRWLGYSGTRWGIDRNEDGQIDEWRWISAEEVTFEIFAAIRDQDPERFQRVLLSPRELEKVGLSPERRAAMAEALGSAVKRFRAGLSGDLKIDKRAEWVHFGAVRPGVIPQGAEGATRDVILYENVAAMIESAGKHGQLPIGTLILVDQGWRAVDIPLAMLKDPLANQLSQFHSSLNRTPEQPAVPENTVDEAMKDLIAELAKAQKETEVAKTPQEKEASHKRSVGILRQLAAKSKTKDEQSIWIRQLADTLHQTAQSGEYPEAIQELNRLHDELNRQAPKEELTAYVRFRLLLANYSLAVQKPDVDFAEVQSEWMKQLEQFANDFPTADDTPEAMWQLAVAEEFSGNDDKSLEWCDRILQLANGKQGLVFRKAEGAKRRLTSVGKPLQLRGNTTAGQPLDIQQLKGRMVLVHFWTTWSKACLDDIAILEQLAAKYKNQFLPVGVNLDQDPKQVTGFLMQKKITWPQMFAPGGLDSPLAIDLGVSSVPTMILVDPEGKVIDRNVNVADLQEYLSKKLR